MLIPLTIFLSIQLVYSHRCGNAFGTWQSCYDCFDPRSELEDEPCRWVVDAVNSDNGICVGRNFQAEGNRTVITDINDCDLRPRVLAGTLVFIIGLPLVIVCYTVCLIRMRSRAIKRMHGEVVLNQSISGHLHDEKRFGAVGSEVNVFIMRLQEMTPAAALAAALVIVPALSLVAGIYYIRVLMSPYHPGLSNSVAILMLFASIVGCIFFLATSLMFMLFFIEWNDILLILDKNDTSVKRYIRSWWKIGDIYYLDKLFISMRLDELTSVRIIADTSIKREGNTTIARATHCVGIFAANQSTPLLIPFPEMNLDECKRLQRDLYNFMFTSELMSGKVV